MFLDSIKLSKLEIAEILYVLAFLQIDRHCPKELKEQFDDYYGSPEFQVLITEQITRATVCLQIIRDDLKGSDAQVLIEEACNLTEARVKQRLEDILKAKRGEDNG